MGDSVMVVKAKSPRQFYKRYLEDLATGCLGI